MGLKKLKEREIVNLEDFAKIVHSQSDAFVAVCTKDKNGIWVEKMFESDVWYNEVTRTDASTFYSVNSMYRKSRRNYNARHINCFYVDVDFYNQAISKDDAIAAIDFLVKKEMFPEPTFLVDSGRGLYCLWVIESVPGRFSSVQKLYARVEEYLIDSLEEVGSDAQAKDIARVLKVPFSVDIKSGKTVTIERFTDVRYTMRLFQQIMNENTLSDFGQDKEKGTKKKAQKRAKNNVKYLFTLYSLAVARAADLENVIKQRDFSIMGYRNAFLHIYAYQQLLIHNHYFVARSKVVELNEKLNEPLQVSELDDVFKSVFRAYENHRENPKLGYNYRNDTIIKKLNISVEEQRKLKTIISTEIKYERNNERRTPKIDGLSARERAKREKVDRIHELKKQGLKNADIAKKLGIGKGTVSKYLKM